MLSHQALPLASAGSSVLGSRTGQTSTAAAGGGVAASPASLVASAPVASASVSASSWLGVGATRVWRRGVG